MKICWDNLEGIEYTKGNKWRKKRSTGSKYNYYEYIESCKECGEPFFQITDKRLQQYCCRSCIKISEEHKKKISKAHKGFRHTKETKRKMSEFQKERCKNPKNCSMYGKKHTEETKKKMSKSGKGKHVNENSSKWDGGYSRNNIPSYDTYAHQIDWCESVRRNKNDRNILEVKCTYCRKWFIPKRTNIQNRIQVLKGKFTGEYRLYCSESCKQKCPIYNKSPEQLMKEDAVKSGRIKSPELGREIQSELRQMVLERDGYQCIKCGSKESLHCHHIDGIHWNPIESADIDICVTLCKSCHIDVHKEKDCTYYDHRCIAA